MHFTFRVCDPFGIILCEGVDSVSRFIFFARGGPVVSAPFVEETIFAPL